MKFQDIKMSRAIRLQMMSLFSGIILFGHFVWVEAALPPVSIGVSQSNMAGVVVYQYLVTNQSSFPITSIVIGVNYFSGLPEIRTPPLGWSVTDGIPPSSVVSPTGWTARIIRTEDTDLLELEWGASANAIAP